MTPKAIALGLVGAAVIVAGILLIVEEQLPAWVPDWDGEMRLVVGLGISFVGFVIFGIAGLSGVAGLQSSTPRMRRGGGSRGPGGNVARRSQRMAGLLITGSLALGVAGGLVNWYRPVMHWVTALAWLDREYRLLIGSGMMVLGLLGLIMFGTAGRVPRGGAPPPVMEPPDPLPPDPFRGLPGDPE